MRVALLVVMALLLHSSSADRYIGGHGDKLADQPPPSQPANPPTDPPGNPQTQSSQVADEQETIQSRDTTKIGGIVEVAYGKGQGVISSVPRSATPGGPFPNPNPSSISLPAPQQNVGGFGGTNIGNTQDIKQVWSENGADQAWPIPESTQNQSTSWPVTSGGLNNESAASTTSTADADSSSSSSASAGIDRNPAVYGGSVMTYSTQLVSPNEYSGETPDYMGYMGYMGDVPELPVDSSFQGIDYGGKVQAPRVDVSGHCISWGHPQSVLSFDGKHISFQGLGEFVMFSSESLVEQVNILQQRSGRTSFNKGFAFRSGQNTLSVGLETAQGDESVEVVAVRLNGRPISMSASQNDLGGFSILQEGRLYGSRRLSIVVRNPNGVKVAGVFYNRRGFHHMNIFLQVEGNYFGVTKGLCGRFNFNPADDMETPDRQVVSNAQQFATSWAVQHELSSFKHHVSEGEPFVLPAAITSFEMSQDKDQFERAKHECRIVQKSFREECRLNRLNGGRRSVEEVSDVAKIAQNSNVKLDSDGVKCSAQHFSMDAWGAWSDCSSTCSEGVRFRTRNMYQGEHRCGQIKQTVTCRGACSLANIWAKCAMWGSGHQVTFDRAEFDFQATGEYVAYHDPNAKEQVNIIRYWPSTTSPIALTSGVAFRFGADIFTAQIQAPSYTDVAFTFNRQVITLNSAALTLGFLNVRLAGNDPLRTIVEIRAVGGTTLTLAIETQSGYARINTFLEIHGSKIGDTHGLCGVWDFNSANDFQTASGRIHTNPAVSSWSYRVGSSESFFVFPVPAAKQDSIAPVLVESLKPAPQAVLDAEDACDAAQPRLRKACILDVIFINNMNAAKDTLDAQAVVDEQKLSASNQVAICLRSSGAQLSEASNWTTECTAKCGGGDLSRTQQVVKANGEICGPLVISKPCNTQPCLVDCVQSSWSQWSACSNTCGDGVQNRSRSIVVYPTHSGAQCGSVSESQFCNSQVGCCDMGNFSNWGPCLDGRQERSRRVNFAKCGHNKEVRPCCEFSRWSDWSDCTDGAAQRTRFMRGDDATCSGYASSEQKPCCQVAQYGDWGTCTNGVQIRQRQLSGNSATCQMWNSTESQTCCSPSSWSEWGACTKYGFKHRFRELSGNCENFESKATQKCCDVSPWSPWSGCVNGEQSRVRDVSGDEKLCSTVARFEKHKCCIVHQWSEWSECLNGQKSRNRRLEGDSQTCTLHPAVESTNCCQIGDWSDWSACVDGIHNHSRIVVGNDATCSEISKKEMKPCCDVTPWSAWSQCDPVSFTRTRARSVNGDAVLCAQSLPTQTEQCCVVNEFGPWSTCTNGQVTRSRTVQGSVMACTPFPADETHPCCHLEPWGDWGECTDGYFERTRKFDGDAAFCATWKTSDKRPCCEVGVWSDWTKCHLNSATDIRSQARTRNVTGLPEHCGGIQTDQTQSCCEISAWSGWSDCNENGFVTRVRKVKGDTEACFNVKSSDMQPCCTVGNWSAWSLCMNGNQNRSRSVQGHQGCELEFTDLDSRVCGPNDCSVGAWSEWSTCDGKSQSKTRTVQGPAGCAPALDSRPCGSASYSSPTCAVSEWSEWHGCDGGFQKRTRTLNGNCPVDAVETAPCALCTPGDWAPFNDCDSNQTKTRIRALSGNCGPEVESSQTFSCNCTLGDWGNWTNCANQVRSCTRSVSPECGSLVPSTQVQKCVDCVFGQWSEWTGCMADGTTSRKRDVTGDCSSFASTFESQPCCDVETWGKWSDCDNGGKQTRSRGVFGDASCFTRFLSNETQDCCTVGSWSEWVSDEIGWRTRSRNVTASVGCQQVYPTVEREKHCNVGSWSQWSDCDSSTAHRSRTRFVDDASHCKAMYPAEETEPCCQVGGWSTWSNCVTDPVSNVATKFRSRNVLNTSACLTTYSTIETRSCAECVLGPWGPFGPCLPDGYRVRSRDISGDPVCAQYNPREEKRSCCQIGAWEPWSTCVNGQESRTRAVSNMPYCLNSFANIENRTCACKVSQWQAWSECEPVTATKTHNREVVGDQRCIDNHPRSESASCCEPGSWSQWSQCNGATFTQTRSRAVTPDWASCKQIVSTNEQQPCCVVSAWAKWGECSKGQQTKSRSVLPASQLCLKNSEPSRKRSCCSVEPFSQWSTCQMGVQARVRSVYGPAACLASNPRSETQACCSASDFGPVGPCVNGLKSRMREVYGGDQCRDQFPAEEKVVCQQQVVSVAKPLVAPTSAVARPVRSAPVPFGPSLPQAAAVLENGAPVQLAGHLVTPDYVTTAKVVDDFKSMRFAQEGQAQGQAHSVSSAAPDVDDSSISTDDRFE